MSGDRRLTIIGARVALLGFGVALGLAGLELMLRLAGPLLRPALRGFERPAVSAPAGTLRVLCLGDSHTYGLWVKPQQSYPAQLQRMLARHDGHFVILNAGVPGMNSSQVRDAVPKLLDSFSPDIVLLMVGVADGWNLAGSHTEELRGWRWWIHGGGLWDRSRVVKFARLIWFNLRYRHQPRAADLHVVEHTSTDWRIDGGDAEIAVAHDAHFEDPISDPRVFRRILHRDLVVITSAIEAHGARLILLTYSTDSFLYGAANDVYRAFARETGLPLVDLGARLKDWSVPPRQAVAFFPDFHPRPVGYRLVARILADTLRGELDRQGALDRR